MTARVLVVDDVLANVKLLEARLTAEYFDVVTAMSGPEALAICERAQCDIVLLDIMMPDMDGFEVCRALKEDPRTAEIPVIMITARDDLDARAEGMRLGVSDFLAKPVFRRQLANRIRAQLDMLATGRATEAALSQFEDKSEHNSDGQKK